MFSWIKYSSNDRLCADNVDRSREKCIWFKKAVSFRLYRWKPFTWISWPEWWSGRRGVEGERGMSVGWKGRCASVLWHGVIDRHLATPSCSRRVDKGVDKGVEKGVETLSCFHGSVTGSRSPCHPFASWCTRYMHHPAIRLYFPDSCVCSCRCREDQICKLCAKEPLL